MEKKEIGRRESSRKKKATKRTRKTRQKVRRAKRSRRKVAAKGINRIVVTDGRIG